jgi:hypothetical protein
VHDKNPFDGKTTDMSPKFERHNVTEAQQCDTSEKHPFHERPFAVEPTGHFICSNVLLAGLLRSQKVRCANYAN